MTYLKYKKYDYRFEDFKNHNVYISDRDYYKAQAIDATTMNSTNTTGSNLVCIATFRTPDFENGGSNYYYYHVEFYNDVKEFLNLTFQEHDDNWFIFIPVNGNGQDIVDNIKSFCKECEFVELLPR